MKIWFLKEFVWNYILLAAALLFTSVAGWYTASPIMWEKEQRAAYAQADDLPLGYTSAAYIPAELFEKYSPAEKEQILLQGVVLEDSSLPRLQPWFDDLTMDYRFENAVGCIAEMGRFLVEEDYASVDLTFHGMRECEVCFLAEGLRYEGLPSAPTVQAQTALRISSDRMTREKQIMYDQFRPYPEDDDILCGMGYYEGRGTRLTLTFQYAGVYSYDTLSVFCQPVENLIKSRDRLCEEILEVTEMTPRTLSGEIHVSEPKALVLEIPYSEKLRAVVDGEAAELKRANKDAAALELSKGGHEIRISYYDPVLFVSAYLTLPGVVCYTVLVICQGRRKKNRQPSSLWRMRDLL